MDLIVRNARLTDRPTDEPLDIGVAAGKIVAIEHGLADAAETYDAGGRLACAGLIERTFISTNPASSTAFRPKPDATSAQCDRWRR